MMSPLFRMIKDIDIAKMVRNMIHSKERNLIKFKFKWKLYNMATPSRLVNGPRTLQSNLQVLDNLHDLSCGN